MYPTLFATTLQFSKHCRYAKALGASTILGSRIVKLDPRPGSLSTVISPPIIWQNRLLIASPRPVPHVFAGRGGRCLGELLK
jgi:hypothetical protein